MWPVSSARQRSAPEIDEQDATPPEQEMREFQKKNTIAALRQANWRVSGAGGAADLLGIKPTTLASRIKKMGIERPV